YMAMGRGIVASNLDQIGEILEHNRTGWLVKPGDAQALAEGMEYLVCHMDEASRLGKAARLEVLKKHTWKKHTERIVEAYRKLYQ
ncbi:glycosyltransferase, partial [Magnetococcales bacterium HHB-1]